eukprot:scaffold1976_cov56-Phaeocystis_antarctica.AAC.1
MARAASHHLRRTPQKSAPCPRRGSNCSLALWRRPSARASSRGVSREWAFSSSRSHRAPE